jgi:hypothetical protein
MLTLPASTRVGMRAGLAGNPVAFNEDYKTARNGRPKGNVEKLTT